MVHMVRKLHKDEPFPKPNQLTLFIYLFILFFFFLMEGDQ